MSWLVSCSNKSVVVLLLVVAESMSSSCRLFFVVLSVVMVFFSLELVGKCIFVILVDGLMSSFSRKIREMNTVKNGATLLVASTRQNPTPNSKE